MSDPIIVDDEVHDLLYGVLGFLRAEHPDEDLTGRFHAFMVKWMDARTPHELEQARESMLAFITRKCWMTIVKTGREIKGKCDRGSCDKPAKYRIRLNIHGTLTECDVCSEHAVRTTVEGRVVSRDGDWCDGP